MTRGQSYYDLFGLKQDATATEIRASYLRLLKQHHPDRACAGEQPAKPELVPLINRCYSVLKDSQKRAAYDAQLRGRVAVPAAHLARSSRHVTVGWTARKSLLAVALAFGAASLASFMLLAQAAPPGFFESESRFAWPISDYRARPASDRSPTRRAEEARRQAHLARSVSGQRAEQLSQQCFANARRDPDASAAELCILFDQAFLYWRKVPGDFASLPIYFNEEVMQMRHIGALSATRQQDIDSKLRALREEAFRALLQDVSRPDPASPEAAKRNEASERLSNSLSQNETVSR